ncbi:hypothetical protein AX14_004766 [Amanita brunnescens Koide BX004]|nr:hypothetical protein AX14_004766 [Amanita brunnescens Koide BX004]
MLTACHLPSSLWLAGIQHAAYLQNHSYTCAIPDCTPYKCWFKEWPDVTHLREFRTPVYVLREGENQSKVQPKALKHTFIGFDDPISSIRYYDACSHQIKTSCNFTFTAQHEGEGEVSDAPSVNVEKNDSIPSMDIGDASSSQECEGMSGGKQPAESRKRKRETYDDSRLPRCSTRPRVIHDYRKLNDPGLPKELAAVMQEEEKDLLLAAANAVYIGFNDSSPKMLQEAKASPDWPEWEKAIITELKQLHEMGTWEMADAPHDRKPIANKWVFLQKFDKNGILTKYKARLMSKGFSQIPGMDFNQTFAPVTCLETLQSVIAETVQRGWKLRQMDVKGAYLNGLLKEEVYMAQPEGFDDGTGRVCRLIKTLYGLKQSGREWNEQLNKKLTEKGFS